ncbi:MAG TPA: hypothetical protein VG899_04100 [Mycobacteriales bacterium]|nr:hypothetical protein [Mycobacteriales bacterium]
MKAWLIGAALLGAAACSQDISTVGGGQILEFRNDLSQPVTFLYCPAQGCDLPLTQLVAPGQSWRTQNETINGSGAVAVVIDGRASGCRLVAAVGLIDDPLKSYDASFVRGGPACVRLPPTTSRSFTRPPVRSTARR